MMAEDLNGNAKWQDIKDNVKEVLQAKHPETIRKNSFWNEYKNTFGELPGLKYGEYRIESRSKILDLCSEFCEIAEGDDGFEYVGLKSVTLTRSQRRRQKQKEKKRESCENDISRDHSATREEKATDAGQPKRIRDKGSDILSQLAALQNRSSGAYSKLSGKAPPVPTTDTEPVFDISREFPKLGEEQDRDSMAMRDRNRGSYNYHPYVQQQAAHDQPADFYDQFYSSGSQSSRSSEGSRHRQHQQPSHGSNSDWRGHHQQSDTRTYHQGASASHYSQYATPTRDRHPGPSRSRDEGHGSRSYSRTPGSQHGSQQSIHASKEQLNLVAKEAITLLADTKEYVSVERVEKLILQHFNASSLSQLSVRNIEHIDAVRELMRAHGKVNAYIQAFMRTRSVSTLHELQGDLENLCCKQGEEFDSLQVGPLQTQPLVYDFFKFPEKSSIPAITTADVLDMLRDWLSQNNLWSSRDLDLQKFMEFMQETRGLDTPYELGVRIRSLILLIQVLKRAQSECGRSVKDIMKRQKDNFKDDLSIAFDNLTRTVLQKDPGAPCVVKRQYLEETSPVVVIDVFDKIKLFYDTLCNIGGRQSGHFLTREEKKGCKQLNDTLLQFKNAMLGDPVHRDIFRMAVCASCEEIHEQLWDRIVKHFEKRIPTKAPQHIRYDSDDDVMVVEEGASAAERKGPSRGQVEENVLKYLQRGALAGLTLDILNRIEAKVLEDFGFDNFKSLGHGSFLECLTSIQKIKTFLEESGGLALGGAQHGGGKGVESVYHTTQHQLLDFLRQAAVGDPQHLSLLEDAMCSHYRVTDVKNLGHGTAQHLMAISAKQQQRQAKEFTVFYEGAMCASARGLRVSGERQVGVLGHQSKDKVLACLQSCPLMDSLEEWSHWDLVFRPEYGDLKEFVQKNGKVHNMNITAHGEKYTMTTHIVAMETKPGTLLKLTSDTSPDKFEKAVHEADVTSTCGHLLSLLAMNKGIGNLPMPLLGNHLKAALIKMQAQEESAAFEGEHGHRTKVPRVCVFVVECLSLLPLATCQAVANKVFLEPLSQVVGSTKSKDLLFHAASTNQQRGRLQILGCALGIHEWVKTFENRMEPPRECLEKHDVPMELAEMGGPIEISDSDEESDDSEAEDTAALEDLSSGDEDEPLSQEDDAHAQSGTPEVEESAAEKLAGDGLEKSSSQTDQSEAGMTTAVQERREEERTDDNVSNDKVDEDDEVAKSGDVTSGVSVVTEVTPPDPCFALIEQIRRDKFGVNVEMDENVRNLFQNHKEIIGRSLDRLSKDLYSKDTHFVLELIQNADDNDYPGLASDGFHVTADAPPPSVLFRVEQDKISVFNNETGFKETNIKAVCDVGRSTKGKHKFGYIGQKGIGFKSVFRVTDRPEIHSNGFHICFDVHSGPMGYIMPHWIGKVPKDEQEMEGEDEKDSEDERKTRENEIPNEDREWTTSIVLPLKQTAKEQGQLRSLAARFHDVHPSLLLFLHRLRSLTVINKVEDYEQDIRRRDQPNDVVEISHSSGTDRWLVVKQMLDASKISQQAKSGVDVESTEIALAFQLQDKEQIDTQVLPQKQPVFAFLPLRSYGFRFVIQGDFDVPSSREDVDRDSVWNQWLIGSVHELFLKALQAFKTQLGINEVDAVCSFLQYLPLEDEILDFFRPVATKILHQIRAKPCLPTQPGKNKAIQWRMPSKLVVCKDSLVRDIVKSELLQKQLSLDYLHPEVVSRLNGSLIGTLGVQTLTTQHLLDLGKTTISELDTQESNTQDGYSKKLEFLAKWLTCIFRSIDEIQPDQAVMTQLKQLSIIPLANSEMVSLNEKTVFFPITDERKNSKKKLSSLMRLLAQDLNTIEPQLFSGLDDVANSQVHKLLDMLGVKVMTPYEVINHHIMPVLKSDAKRGKSRDMLFAYLVYIKEELETQPDLLDKEELKAHAIVLTNQGPRNPATHAVHFSTVYGNAIDLPRMLPGYSWVLVDACYLQGSKGKHDVQGWYTFLSHLGVLDFLSVTQTTRILKRDDLDNSPWAAEKDLLPELAEYKVSDSFSTELGALLAQNEHKESYFLQMKSLYQLLDINFDVMFKQHTGARIMTSEGQLLRDVESTFALYLKSIPWLPATEVKSTDSAELVQKCETRLAKDLYVRSPEIEQLLFFHVPYLDCEVVGKSSFSDFLGIQKSIKIDTVKNLLVQWCAKDSDEEVEEGLFEDGRGQEIEFVTSLGHMKRVYSFLQENLTPKDFQDMVQKHPVIFHASSVPTSEKEIIRGSFLSCQQVWWCDRSGMFDKYKSLLASLEFRKLNKRVLMQLYPEPAFRDMFVRQGRVPAGPDFQEYARLLKEIPVAVPIVKNSIVDVLKLYSILASKILYTEEGLTEREDLVKLKTATLKQILKDHRIVPTKAGRYVRLDESPMIADDRQLEKMWTGKPGVHLLDLGEKMGIGKGSNRDAFGISLDMVRAMVRALGLASLSEMTEMEPTTEMYEPCPAVQLYVHRVVPYVQKLLLTEHSDVYDQMLARQIKNKLAVLQFAQVSKLELVYKLKNLPDCEPVVKLERCRLINDQEFSILKEHVNSYSDINRELARFFSQGNQSCAANIRGYLTDIFEFVEEENSAELQRLLDSRDITSLPENEEAWEVPKPINWPPPPSPPPPVFPMVYPGQLPMFHDDTGQEMPENETLIGSDVKDEPGVEKKTGVRAWPPQAPTAYMSHKPGEERRQKSSWPPPAPPKNTNYKELPEGMRMPPRKPEATQGEENEDTERHQEGEGHGFQRPGPPESRGSSHPPTHGPRRHDSERPRSPGAYSHVSEGGTRHPGASHAGAAHPGSGQHHVVPHNNTPQVGSVPEVESYRTVQPPGSDQTSMETSADAGPTAVQETSANAGPTAAQVSRSQSQIEMEYVEDNDVQVVRVEENWVESVSSHPSSRTPTKRARMDSSECRKYDERTPRKPVVFYGNPVWTEATNETVYEELAQSKDIALPEDVGLAEDGSALDVAVWGERLVYSYLLQLQNDPDSDVVEVTWMNGEAEYTESGAPYDFALKVTDPQDQETLDIYIEVKSTRNDKKAFFEISSQQFRFAQEVQENFHLYRVFNAGDQTKARLTKLVNISQLLDRKQVRLCMVV